MSSPAISIRPATPADAARLEAIREAAFAPVFASFRSMLGDAIYELAQARDDANHHQLLTSLLAPDSGWEVHAVEQGGEIVGFVSLRTNAETQVGELGLNAVDPSHAGRGIGTAMYEWALRRLKAAGMRVATVGTGGDPSHAPARRAYEKAGFDAVIPTVWMFKQLD
jgi:ribosomal protein S18 acetylase RimI-like enzyme